ncbi:hypothetical protein Taro_054153 [Colocasia esculenta]|uniref:Uncharacterized protein n=1 Tax=Colocasia esculenta TaxID=4460 RepID=A0A843XP66_COLES|nr:hypothetical protein [Colocasia esculenta]
MAGPSSLPRVAGPGREAKEEEISIVGRRLSQALPLVLQVQYLRTRRPDRSRSQGHHDSTFHRDLIATGSIVAICLPELTSPLRSVQGHVAFSVDPVATLTRCILF